MDSQQIGGNLRASAYELCREVPECGVVTGSVRRVWIDMVTDRDDRTLMLIMWVAIAADAAVSAVRYCWVR